MFSNICPVLIGTLKYYSVETVNSLLLTLAPNLARVAGGFVIFYHIRISVQI